jgi:hypothetical protein
LCLLVSRDQVHHLMLMSLPDTVFNRFVLSEIKALISSSRTTTAATASGATCS